MLELHYQVFFSVWASRYLVPIPEPEVYSKARQWDRLESEFFQRERRYLSSARWGSHVSSSAHWWLGGWPLHEGPSQEYQQLAHLEVQVAGGSSTAWKLCLRGSAADSRLRLSGLEGFQEESRSGRVTSRVGRCQEVWLWIQSSCLG